MSETKKRQLRTFPHLVARTFSIRTTSPLPQVLQAVPGLDKVIAKIMEYGLERVFYLEHIAVERTGDSGVCLHDCTAVSAGAARSSVLKSLNCTSRSIRCRTPIHMAIRARS